MASTAQVGRGIGSALGLFFGIREGDKRRKRAVKAKADLDEKKLQEARDKQLRAARLKIFLEGDLEPEQRETFLSKKGFVPITGEDREERLEEAAVIRRRQQLGLTKQPLANLIEGGSVEEPGFVRGPGDIATQAKTEAGTEKLQAETRLVEKKILTEQQRAESQKQLAARRKRVESATASRKVSEKRLALNTLQSGLVTRIKSLDRIIEEDPLVVFAGTETAKKDRADLIEELLGVTKELRAIGGVKETKKPKRVSQSDITKMSIDELFEILTKK